jgi:hypothetical protein
MSDEKKWNVPSAIAFVGALIVGATMVVVGIIHKDAASVTQGSLVLTIAGGIAAPQPVRGDR